MLFFTTSPLLIIPCDFKILIHILDITERDALVEERRLLPLLSDNKVD